MGAVGSDSSQTNIRWAPCLVVTTRRALGSSVDASGEAGRQTQNLALSSAQRVVYALQIAIWDRWVMTIDHGDKSKYAELIAG